MVFHFASADGVISSDCQSPAPFYKETMLCPEVYFLKINPWTNAQFCEEKTIDYNGVPYVPRLW
jgi:hypothetical protein